MKRSIKQQIHSITQQFPEEHQDNVEDYLIDVYDTAELNSVDVILSPNRLVDHEDGSGCNGYFEEAEKDSRGILTVATGQPFNAWFPILIHEACHMDQWLENIPLWDGCELHGVDSLEMLSQWYESRVELTREQFDYWCKPSQMLELDNERRVVKKIKKWNLPIDTTWYTKRANSYIYFYTFMWETRQWYTPGLEPYNIPELVDAMPDHFDNDYSIVPDEMKTLWFRKLMEKKNG